MIPYAKVEWFSLGLQLLDPKYENELKTIEAADVKNDVATSCMKMFSKWLETDELSSWDKLIKALEKVQLNSLARDIKIKFQQGEYTTSIATLICL